MTWGRVSLLPGRLSRIAARVPSASRTSNALNVTSPTSVPFSCSASVYSVAARRSSRASVITSSSCASGM